jgi:anaerobic ribonucleoside-triphosphate reductase
MIKSAIDIVSKFTSSNEDATTDQLKRENSNFVYSLPLLRNNIDGFVEEEYLMKHIFSKELVEASEEGIIYIHDKKLSSYCLSVSCKDIANKGIPTIAKNMIESDAPTSIDILIRQFSNVVVLMSQQVSGAVMLSQMTTILASYLHNEFPDLDKNNKEEYDKVYKKVYKLLKSLIWELNLPLRSGSQSAFSNITIEFGKPSEEIKNDPVIIGGEIKDYLYKDITPVYFNIINKAIIDVMAEGTGRGIPFTFPLITVQIDDNFNYDNESFLLLLDKMYNWGGVYFENFKTQPFENEYYKSLNPRITSKDPEVSRSLCPLDGSQEVVYYSEKLRMFISSPIENIYSNFKKCNKDYKFFLQNGKVVKGRINVFKENEYAEITLMNNLKIKTTLNHLNKTLRGDEIKTKDLTLDDYMPFSKKQIEGKGLTYEDGLLVGSFLGDGSYLSEKQGICLSLHEETDAEFIKQITNIVEEKFGGYVSINNLKTKCVNVRIVAHNIVGLIKDFVRGDTALTKSLNLKSINKSLDFRKGIVDGLYQTDGGNNNRIYTSSLKMVNSLATLFASLGTTINVTEDNRKNRLSDNVCYTVRWYEPTNKKFNYKGVYTIDEDYMWFKIKDIKYYTKNKNSQAYCVEVLDDSEPYFMLSNGIITHNCRLQVSLDLLSKVGGGLFGSSTGSTGAVQVLNLNLNRIFMEHQTEDNIKKAIRHYFEIMQEAHQLKRKWIESNKELYPTFFAFNPDLKNFFNVFAVTGGHEALINIGYKDGLKNKEGKAFMHKIMNYTLDIIDEFIIRDNVPCGLEYAPVEGASVKLARKDLAWAKKNNKDIFVQGTGEDIFITSGCMLPFSEDNFVNQIENASEFQSYATSGSILHHFLESKVPPKQLARYINRIFDNPINYITLSPTSSSCMNCFERMIAVDGKNIEVCPKCGSDDIATFSRIIGYVKMISRKNIRITKEGKYEGDYNFWSNAKRIDWNERKKLTSDNITSL